MKFILLVISLLFVSQGFANSRSYDRTWLGLFGKRAIGEKYYIWTEGQARLDNNRFTDEQILLRPGVLRKLDDKNEIGLLYAFVETKRIREHRPTFQYVHSFLKEKERSFSMRNRFEYRKREDLKTVSGRYRGLIRYEHASYIIWEEPFINITREDWTGNRFFERNRFFLGKAIPFDDTKLEIGYMNQFTPRKNKDTIEHILTAYFYY